MAAPTEILADVPIISVRLNVISRAADGSGRYRAAVVVVGITDPAASAHAEVHPDLLWLIRGQEVVGYREGVVRTFNVSLAWDALRVSYIVDLAHRGEAARIAGREARIIRVAGLAL